MSMGLCHRCLAFPALQEVTCSCGHVLANSGCSGEVSADSVAHSDADLVADSMLVESYL